MKYDILSVKQDSGILLIDAFNNTFEICVT